MIFIRSVIGCASFLIGQYPLSLNYYGYIFEKATLSALSILFCIPFEMRSTL